MFTKLHQRARDEKGFTLIELLVVILIIGILAAIAIPSFLGQRTKATDSTAKSAVKTAQTAAETFFTDEQSYATIAANGSNLKTIEPTLNDAPGSTLAVSNQSADGYTVTVTSRTGVTFAINRLASGQTTRTCAVSGGADRGGCKANGSW